MRVIGFPEERGAGPLERGGDPGVEETVRELGNGVAAGERRVGLERHAGRGEDGRVDHVEVCGVHAHHVRPGRRRGVECTAQGQPCRTRPVTDLVADHGLREVERRGEQGAFGLVQDGLGALVERVARGGQEPDRAVELRLDLRHPGGVVGLEACDLRRNVARGGPHARRVSSSMPLDPGGLDRAVAGHCAQGREGDRGERRVAGGLGGRAGDRGGRLSGCGRGSGGGSGRIHEHGLCVTERDRGARQHKRPRPHGSR
ncbi:hypothetical protein RGU41_08235 [Cryobacterium sp. 10C3]|nr:hypothetical protein [Cryobacterium sp. 10C3]MDY7556734.1 hypothetical protein [Cryobacterium sp. 10C3]